MALETRKTLVLCTSHVSAETAEMLNGKDCQQWPCVGGPYSEYGWIVSCHHDDDKGGAIPADLMAIFEFARSNDCTMVLLDRDANEVDGLATYEW